MKYQCDTAKECGWSNCGRQGHHGYHSGPVGCDQWYNCKHAGHRVRCNPMAVVTFAKAYRSETHTCYFCNHTGQDVNRIARLAGCPGEEDIFYCCDDAVACDHRWQEG